MNKKQKSGPPMDPKQRGYSAHWAGHWRVTGQAVRDWLARDGMPAPHDIPGMIRWASSPGKKPRAFMVRVAELRINGGEVLIDPDWEDFVKSRGEEVGSDPLVEVRDYYQRKLRKANAAGSEHDVRNFSDLVIKYEKAIRDNKLAAEKLGIEIGQLVPRTEVERVVFALAYWLLRSTDQHLDALTGKLKALAPGLEAAAVRAVLEPELLSDRFIVPMAQAAKIQNGVSLPDWLVAKMREGCGDFIEKGEKEFDSKI